MRQIDRVVYLRSVCDHMRTHGAVRFTLYITEDEMSVMLRGWDPMDKLALERCVHRVRRRLGDKPYDIRDRVRKALYQYQDAL